MHPFLGPVSCQSGSGTIDRWGSFIGGLRRAVRTLRICEKIPKRTGVGFDRKLENKGTPELSIIPGQENRLFMEELLLHYEGLSYAFPFLSFSFGASSGENALLSLWADLYGIWEDLRKGNSRTGGQASDCNTLLLILDEADLSLHPRWQRMYMKWLTAFCRRYFLPMINIKLIITTHSPVILSDFPPNSVCYLRKDEDGHWKPHPYTLHGLVLSG